jgi:hypothetical protein
VKTYSFYDAGTGLFTGKRLHCDDAARAQSQLPSDISLLEGAFDPLSQRVQLTTGAVVDYQPPAPSPDHEWNPTAKRWRLRLPGSGGQERRAAILERIRALEANQGRALREATLGDAMAFRRLKEIDSAIAGLRQQLTDDLV